MPWYGWLGWIITIVAICVIVVFLVYFYKGRQKYREVVNLLKVLQSNKNKAVDKLKDERFEKRKVEVEKRDTEIKLLEFEHKGKLDGLSVKKRKEYEKARANPSIGVDYMREFIGVQPNSSGSKQD